MDDINVEFELNGQPVTASGPPKRPTLDVLREDVGLCSLKPGCSPQGVCGSCAALVNGKFRLTCTLPMKSLAGKSLQTLEGMDPERVERAARALVANDAVLSGYEAPGLVVQAMVISEDEAPDEARVERALQMHLSRDTGWEAVKAGLAQARDQVELPPGSRWQGVELALGQRPFVDDIQRPGMLHAALVTSPHPACRIDAIDTTAAQAAPGVVAVYTAADLEEGVGQLGLGRRMFVGVGEDSGCLADVVAMVVAERRDQARAARVGVLIEATPVEEIDDNPEFAGLPDVRAELLEERGDGPSEVGEVKASASWSFPSVDPGSLEGEAAIAIPRADGVLHLLSCGEDAAAEHAALVEALGTDAIEVELVGTGGGFGARTRVSVQAHAAWAASRLDRPVKLSVDLEEGCLMHGGRQAGRVHLVLRADPDGRFRSLKGTAVGDAGGWADGAQRFVDGVASQATGPYAIDDVQVEARSVRTHNRPASGAHGDGSVQWAFALEDAVNRLAEGLGRDPVELRVQNLAPEHAGLADLLKRLPSGASGLALALVPPRGEVRVRVDAGRVLVSAAGLGQSYETELMALMGDGEVVVSSDAPACDGRDPGALLAAVRGADNGDGSAPDAAGRGAVAVYTDDAGALTRVVAVHDSASRLDQTRAMGAVVRGLGSALTEGVDSADGRPDLRLRTFGLLKAKVLPDVELLGGERELAPVELPLLLATGPAVAAAVRQHEGRKRRAVPMNDSEAAYSVGVRRPRVKK